MAKAAEQPGWGLEVKKGKSPGQVFPLSASGGNRLVLGRGKGAGWNLGDQETDPAGTRRVADRHAELEFLNAGWLLRDLDSPSGTFVNRRRLLSGQTVALNHGDLIQLGGIQLVFIAVADKTPTISQAATQTQAPLPKNPTANASVRPAQSQTTGFAFTLAQGTTCRSWDDFLAVAAQHWDALREELTSGRLAGFLAGQGKADMAPNPKAPGTPDERLDDWLARLPTKERAAPELDVHPPRIVVKAVPGGGVVRKSLRVSNVGYRLLRCEPIQVAPDSARWVHVPAPWSQKEFRTAGELVIPVEITIPESLTGQLSASLVVVSNGGTRTVAVSLEQRTPGDSAPPIAPGNAGMLHDDTDTDTDTADVHIRPLGNWLPSGARLAALPAPARIVQLMIIGLVLRLFIFLTNVPWIRSGLRTETEAPDMLGPVAAFAAIGVLLGMRYAQKRKALRDLPGVTAAFACAGVAYAAGLVAIGRVVEPPLSALPEGWTWLHLPISCFVWMILGGIVALALPRLVAPSQAAFPLPESSS